jgi:hypothetical protein
MKAIAVVIVSVLLAVSETSAEDIERSAIQVLSENIRVGARVPTTERRLKVGGAELSVTFVTLNPASNRLNIVLPRNPVGGGAALWDFYRTENADVVLTGGYLDSFAPAIPTGLVRVAGTTFNDPKEKDPVLTGTLCLGRREDPASVMIARYSTQASFDEWSDCIQAGPLMLLGGKSQDDIDALDASLANRITEASKQRQSGFVAGSYERVFVMKDRSGQIVLGTTTPTSLYPLRYLLKQDAAGGGFGADDAILLSGWHTAGLIVSAPDPIVVGNPSVLLPNAIVVNSRHAR